PGARQVPGQHPPQQLLPGRAGGIRAGRPRQGGIPGPVEPAGSQVRQADLQHQQHLASGAVALPRRAPGSARYPGPVPDPQLAGLSVLGSAVRGPIEHVEAFPAPPTVTRVRFSTDEVTSLCPVTGQPDISGVVIEYAPDQLCIESKSLKLYLWSF